MNQSDQVKQKTDIVSIIEEHVKLTKAGTSYKGLCPFHQEKTPSFIVSPELQIFKCFGCGRGGDVFTFLQEYEGLEFYETLKFLADKAGIKLNTNTSSSNSLNQKLEEANALAAKFYHYLLLSHPSGAAALTYIKKDRGIAPDTIKAFQIGAAPSGRHTLFNFLTKKGFDEKILTKSGLIVSTSSGPIDRFRDRVIFPITDNRGNTIALAGRILPEFENKPVGKYINSPETPIYHKSQSLYGLSTTKGEIKRADLAIVVEGELDLLSIWQAGFKNAIAIKGSSLTEEQLTLLSRHAQTIILSLDSDFAGNEAAVKGIKNAQDLELEIKVAKLGKFKDPDEFVKNDPSGYKHALDNAQSIWDFLIDNVFKTEKTNEKIAKKIVPLLASISNSITQAHYVGKVAKMLNIPAEAVFNQLQKSEPNQPKQVKEKVEKLHTQKTRIDLLETRLLELALSSNPEFLLEQENIALIKGHANKRIVRKLSIFLSENKYKPKNFLLSLPSELKQLFIDLSLSGAHEDGQEPNKELLLVSSELKREHLKEELKEVSTQIAKLEKQKNKKDLNQAKQKFADLSKRLTGNPLP